MELLSPPTPLPSVLRGDWAWTSGIGLTVPSPTALDTRECSGPVPQICALCAGCLIVDRKAEAQRRVQRSVAVVVSRGRGRANKPFEAGRRDTEHSWLIARPVLCECVWVECRAQCRVPAHLRPAVCACPSVWSADHLCAVLCACTSVASACPSVTSANAFCAPQGYRNLVDCRLLRKQT